MLVCFLFQKGEFSLTMSDRIILCKQPGESGGEASVCTHHCISILFPLCQYSLGRMFLVALQPEPRCSDQHSAKYNHEKLDLTLALLLKLLYLVAKSFPALLLSELDIYIYYIFFQFVKQTVFLICVYFTFIMLLF